MPGCLLSLPLPQKWKRRVPTSPGETGEWSSMPAPLTEILPHPSFPAHHSTQTPPTGNCGGSLHSYSFSQDGTSSSLKVQARGVRPAYSPLCCICASLARYCKATLLCILWICLCKNKPIYHHIYACCALDQHHELNRIACVRQCSLYTGYDFCCNTTSVVLQ